MRKSSSESSELLLSVDFAAMLLAVRLKWRRLVVIDQSRSVSKVRFVYNINVMDESLVWCR